MESDKEPAEESLQNYLMLREILESGLAKAGMAGNFRDAKGHLIEIQSHFKGLKLRREDREELYARLQKAFTEVNAKIEDERQEFEYEALVNHDELKSEVEKATDLANKSRNFKETWDFLIGVQDRIKKAKLFREQREELFTKLQDAFTEVKNVFIATDN